MIARAVRFSIVAAAALSTLLVGLRAAPADTPSRGVSARPADRHDRGVTPAEDAGTRGAEVEEDDREEEERQIHLDASAGDGGSPPVAVSAAMQPDGRGTAAWFARPTPARGPPSGR